MDGGGGGGAGLLSSFLYAPAPPPPQYGPWNLPCGLFTSLVSLWLTYVYAHVGMLVFYNFQIKLFSNLKKKLLSAYMKNMLNGDVKINHISVNNRTP